MQANQLIQTFESSLSHAQGNYQMIVLETLAYGDKLKEELVNELMIANKGKTRGFFNSHCVFKVLIKKGLIKYNKSSEFYSLNTNATQTETREIIKEARKARKAYEVAHKWMQ